MPRTQDKCVVRGAWQAVVVAMCCMVEDVFDDLFSSVVLVDSG